MFICIIVPMYIEKVPNRNSPPTFLLREGWREGKKIRKRTLANITHWSQQKIDALAMLLKDHTMVPAEEKELIERSLPHGHVEAVLGTIRKTGLEKVISSKRCKERDLVVAMIAERLIQPCSKLATTRLWHSTTLASELGVQDADVGDLYDALDWLLERQKKIENKLAKFHLRDGAQVLYDISSSYYEGHTCVLAHYGNDRDKKGQPVIVYGLLTDKDGRPISIDVYRGNTSDPTTVPDQVDKLRKRFGLSRVVLVGDRGMLTQTQIDKLKEHSQLGWISALRSDSIRKLVEEGVVERSLFDEENLAEITSHDFPGERLVVCFNPFLKDKRCQKRKELLSATEKDLDKIGREVSRRTRKPLTESEIGVKVGRILGRYKMAKHFRLTIEDDRFEWVRDKESIACEEALDGIYIIRTSEPAKRLSAEETVRSYKNLSRVERAFRTMKGIDLLIRPIRHRTEDHVRAHIFLCMLSYYVEWEMRHALASLLFDDEDLQNRDLMRNPVVPVQPSQSARQKKRTLKTTEGLPVHSFDTLIMELGTRCKNFCRVPVSREIGKGTKEELNIRYEKLTEPTPLQTKVFQLLGLFPENGNPD